MNRSAETSEAVLENSVVPEAVKTDVKEESEGFPSLITNTVGEENAQLQTDIVGRTVSEDAAQEIAMDLDMPSTNLNPQADLDHEVITEEVFEIEKDHKEVSNRTLEADLRADKSNNHNGSCFTMKHEGVDGDNHAQAGDFNQSFSFDPIYGGGDDPGTEEEQAAFMKELENFFKEKSLEFKPPKFYGEGLNCLKLWRAVTRLGGYEQVTSCKLWRQVGESFKPPKTCTTVSWSFRCFYEKALLEYEKYKVQIGELQIPISSLPESTSFDIQAGGDQVSGPGRARRDSAARAMQVWHSQRLLGNGELGDPVIKDKVSVSLLKRGKHLKSLGAFKRKKTSSQERAAKVAHQKFVKPQMDFMVVDVGSPADWVKINVRTTKDCFEVYALVPGLLREEVHVQSDPAGRLIISGEPEQPDNPWGVTAFKKVITLPSRIDPHQTSAVVTLHGQLFVRAPFEQVDL
ncbi:AT-rich interactive domain-containing protein 3 [Platanthera guangdongensis]|uniref:AT-rich interactive domain-containing protein 3 n=1 Tax=Platanthera guangdongensis TaxID=2320717 RepID=A0ABR2LFY1_9ASPA